MSQLVDNYLNFANKRRRNLLFRKGARKRVLLALGIYLLRSDDPLVPHGQGHADGRQTCSKQRD
jgi:hypothetical protein